MRARPTDLDSNCPNTENLEIYFYSVRKANEILVEENEILICKLERNIITFKQYCFAVRFQSAN